MTVFLDFLTCHQGGKLETSGTLQARHTRKLLKNPNLPACHHSAARSAHWRTVLTCQLATPVRVASGTQARRQLGGEGISTRCHP